MSQSDINALNDILGTLEPQLKAAYELLKAAVDDPDSTLEEIAAASKLYIRQRERKVYYLGKIQEVEQAMVERRKTLEETTDKEPL